MSDLAGILAFLEKLTKPDPSVDALISCVVGYPTLRPATSAECMVNGVVCDGRWVWNLGKLVRTSAPSPYTSSPSRALSLMPVEFTWMLTQSKDTRGRPFVLEVFPPEGYRATPFCVQHRYMSICFCLGGIKARLLRGGYGGKKELI